MRQKGFTILELLVVIAIIAILVSASVALFAGPKTKSRDARRESDMKEIHNALSIYANDNSVYPVCSTAVTINGTSDCLSSALIGARAIAVVPQDPSQKGVCNSGAPHPASTYAYCYQTSSDGTTFVVYYNRETNGDKPSGWNFITP